MLNGAGFAGPVGPFADALNTAISLARGNWVDAAINAAAMVPAAGDAFKAAKMLDRAARNAFRQSLVKAGKLVEGQAAHHIVEKANELGHAILDKHKISIDAVENGIGLTTHATGGRHTRAYAEVINARLGPLSSTPDILAELKKIEDELRAYDKRGKTVDDWAKDQKATSSSGGPSDKVGDGGGSENGEHCSSDSC
jgi:hypothetical protein